MAIRIYYCRTQFKYLTNISKRAKVVNCLLLVCLLFLFFLNRNIVQTGDWNVIAQRRIYRNVANSSDHIPLTNKYFGYNIRIDTKEAECLSKGGTAEWKYIKSCIGDVLKLTYPNYQLQDPLFISNEDKLKYYNNPNGVPPNKTDEIKDHVGQIHFIDKGIFLPHQRCYYGSEMSPFISRSNEAQKHSCFSDEDNLVPYVPLLKKDGGTFQHFIDCQFPKLIQVLPLIHLTKAKVILASNKVRDSIVLELIHRVGVPRDQVLFFSDVFGRHRDFARCPHPMINTCITPPFHPVSWQKARELLGVPIRNPLPWDQRKIMLATRAGAHNAGRNLVNQDELEQLLSTRYGDRFLLFKGGLKLNETLRLFSEIRLLIGVHGGALVNHNFCPSDTVVVEMFPTYPDGHVSKGLSDSIFWLMTSMIGQPYWRVPETPLDGLNNVKCNITKMKQILDVIDSNPT